MPALRRTSLHPGIYDELVTDRLAALLGALPDALTATTHTVTDRDRTATLTGALLTESLAVALAEARSPADAFALAHDVFTVFRKHAPHAFPHSDETVLRAEQLSAITRAPVAPIERPRGSLHASSLIVNADGDSLLEHLRSEFASADRVDLLCSFVKLSGFERLRSVLEQHCVSRGRSLRILTTTYMGATDALAVQKLAAMPNVEVKISYDETITRLHAKAWVFHRASGYSTGYVGSSNLSHAAQTDGLEWNVRITQADQAALFAQVAETFEQYWSDRHTFERFDVRDEPSRIRLARSLAPASRSNDDLPGFLPEIEPKDYQKPVLEELATARRLGRHRNLLVAATGTGKTMMAALDYRAMRTAGTVDSLLYVAHRREILEQARRAFRATLQVGEFGELLCAGERPVEGRHVFASIDSLHEQSSIDPSRFDMVVLDEAHHAAAATWTRLLDRMRPVELLGLTGTPERSDGIDYDAHFPRPWVGNLRVWNAIPHALVPFRYHVLDVEGVDLGDVAWTAGGYAPDALAGRLVGAAEIFVQRAVRAVRDHVARPDEMRAIAFCANVRHAEEIARRMRDAGIRAEILTGNSPAAQRRSAQRDLDAGRLEVLCVVDIYNEGIDVPNVNTLFFFRPTESATVFLQQLGRGLRRAPRKSELVVFDLTGRQHAEFRFDRRLRALLGHTPRALHDLVAHGFGRLPSGCFVRFEERAREDILAQLERSVPDDRRGILALLREPSHASLSLDEFLHETDVALPDIYRKGRSWTELRASAGLDTNAHTASETGALGNVHKLLHVGDALRLGVWARLVAGQTIEREAERRVVAMLFAVLYGKSVGTGEARARWSADRAVRNEIAGLIPVLARVNAMLTESHVLEPDVPLVLHARYLGVELSAAFDHRTLEGRVRDYFTGVEKAGDGRYDLLLTTLEKGDAVKEHLKYRDFPLSETTFHWQSKATTTRSSEQGRRHMEPEREGCRALLFVRERNDDRPGVTMAFRYLGPVTAAASEGERPMTVTWQLEHPMPGELLREGRIAA